jgi:capsular polysaccharide biosynthesis protein
MNHIHQSFIKSLVLVAVVTIVSMAAARIIVNKVISSHYKSSNFTTQKSQFHSE